MNNNAEKCLPFIDSLIKNKCEKSETEELF